MDKLRELIMHRAYISALEEEIYSDCLKDSVCELLDYLHNGYDENCEKLIDNCLYYEKKHEEAINNKIEYSKMVKRLGLK